MKGMFKSHDSPEDIFSLNRSEEKLSEGFPRLPLTSLPISISPNWFLPVACRCCWFRRPFWLRYRRGGLGGGAGRCDIDSSADWLRNSSSWRSFKSRGPPPPLRLKSLSSSRTISRSLWQQEGSPSSEIGVAASSSGFWIRRVTISSQFWRRRAASVMLQASRETPLTARRTSPGLIDPHRLATLPGITLLIRSGSPGRLFREAESINYWNLSASVFIVCLLAIK